MTQPDDPKTFWEDVYQTRRTTSSGQPSGALVRVAADLSPGRALDLGASHGDDVIWLAQQGWQACGVDVSPTACGRATARAEALGLSDRARFVAHDLAAGWPEGLEGPFDLVTALFFQSPGFDARAAVVAQAADRVAPGGHLVLVSHAEPVPWASAEMKARPDAFPTVAGELAAAGYQPDRWQIITAELVSRQGKAPDGTPATLRDTVVHLRRLAAAD